MLSVDILFVITFFLVPIIAWTVLRNVNISILSLSPPVFTVLSIFILAYVGYFFLYFQLDDYRFEEGVVNKIIVLKAFFFSVVTLVGMILGLLLCIRLFKGRLVISDTSNISPMSRIEFLLLTVLLLFVAFVLTLYVMKVPKLALLVAVLDGVSEAKLVRSDMGNNFSGGYHWYSLFMHQFSAFLAYCFYSAWLKQRTTSLLFVFLCSFFLSSFAMVMSTEKAPFVWFLLGLFFVYILTMKNGHMSFGKVFFFSLVGLGVLILADILFMGSAGLGSAISSVFSRAITGGITPSYFYLEFFPEEQEHLLGRSFPNPGGVLPFEPYNMTVEVMNWVHPEHYESGIVGTAPTVFWAELYANFGWLGVLVGPFFVGFFLTLLTLALNQVRVSPITLGLNAWLILHYKDLSMTGVSGYIFDIKLLSILSFGLIIIVLSNDFRLPLQKKR